MKKCYVSVVSLVIQGLYFKVKCKKDPDATPPSRLCFKVGCKNGMMVPYSNIDEEMLCKCFDKCSEA